MFPPATQVENVDWVHLMRPGETLWELCLAHSQRPDCETEIQRHNRVPNERAIAPGTPISFPIDWLKEPVIVGGVLEAGGDVTVSEWGSSEYGPLEEGQPIYLGDRVRTAEGSTMLELVSGLLVQLRPESEVAIQSISDAEEAPLVALTLERGSMDATVIEAEAGEEVTPGEAPPPVAGDYRVSTPVAEAQVEGAARFSTDDTGQSSRTEALRGNLNLVSGGTSFALLEGQGFAAEMCRMPSAPRALLPPPLFAAPRIDTFNPVNPSWIAGEYASAWQVDLLAEKGSRVLRTLATFQPRAQLGDLAIGCHVLAVRALDDIGIAGRDAHVPLCVHPALSAPRVFRVHPNPGGARNAARVRWAPVEFATGYLVEIAEDSEFRRIARRSDVPGNDAEIVVPREGAWHLRVRAVNAAGLQGPDSNIIALSGWSYARAAAALAIAAAVVIAL